MAFFTPSEQRTRTTQFDTFVASGLEVLDNPAIAEKLQSMDVPVLRAIIESATLPNFRHGKIKIPLRQLFHDTPVIVPFAQEDSNTIQDTVFRHKFNCNSGNAQRYNLKPEMYSKRYGKMFNLEPHGMDIGATTKDAHKTEAQQAHTRSAQTLMEGSIARIFTPSLESFEEGWYMPSRSWLLVKDWLLTEPRNYYRAGGIAVHETVHLQDRKEEPSLMEFSNEYVACSELRGYYASTVVAEHYDYEEALAHQIEAARVEELGEAQFFIPTPRLHSWLQDNRYSR